MSNTRSHIFKFTCLSFTLTLQCLQVSAQQDKTGNWLMYFGMNRVTDRLSIHSEIQYRNHTIAPTNIEQLLLRTGLNYHVSEKAFISAGYAHIGSHEFESEQSGPEIEEHRLWEQLILVNQVNKFKLEHRFRVEQRWQNKAYGNRFRYRLMAFFPLNKQKIEKGTVFIGAYDELFVKGENKLFDRNRLYGSLGYQFKKSTGVQVGMLHQQVRGFGKFYFQMALTINPDFRNN